MVRMRFEGGQELAAALNTLSGSLSRKVLIEGLKEAGEPMRSRMGLNAPREPGAPDLADHIAISTARSSEKSEAAVAVGPERAFFYGLFQEWGTVHHGAQPFMRPAFDSESEKVLKILAAVLWRELAARGISKATRTSHGPLLGER